MIEKEYYRLEDLKNRFNMTEADVLYLLEQRSVKACFYTESTHFVIGGWNKVGFVGYAHVNYRGLIALPDSELQDFDLSPDFNTMTLMRFPIKWSQWRSQNEKTLYRRTNYQSHQAA